MTRKKAVEVQPGTSVKEETGTPSLGAPCSTCGKPSAPKPDESFALIAKMQVAVTYLVDIEGVIAALEKAKAAREQAEELVAAYLSGTAPKTSSTWSTAASAKTPPKG